MLLDDIRESTEKALENAQKVAVQAGETAQGAAAFAFGAAQDAAVIAAGAAQDAAALAAEAAQDAAGRAAEMAADFKRERDLEKYRPVLPESLGDPDFSPRMIVVTDSDERKDIEVCKGAIGWFEKQGDIDVFCLYEEAVAGCGLRFVPFPSLGSVYLYDSLDRNRYIDLGGYFEFVNNEKLVELQSVARMLGAKRIRLEEYAMEKSVSVKKGKGKVKAKGVPVAGGANAAVEGACGVRQSHENEKKVLYEATFQDAGEPKRPELRWYAADPKIHEMIASRFNEEGLAPLAHYHFEISEKTSSTVSQSLAAKVDVALKKMGADANFNFEGEVQTQSRRKLDLDVEF